MKEYQLQRLLLRTSLRSPFYKMLMSRTRRKATPLESPIDDWSPFSRPHSLTFSLSIFILDED